MSWGRLDDRGNGNAKLLALSDAAWRMWGCGLIYCQANLTNGFIPEHAIYSFGVRQRRKRFIVAQLTSILVPGKGPLWHRVEGGFMVHDYLDWNAPAETISLKRQRNTARKARWRDARRGVTPVVTDAVTSGVTDGATDAAAPRDPYPYPYKEEPKEERTSAARTDSSTNGESRKSPDVAVIAALVEKDLLPLGLPADDLPEATKERCAAYHITYDSISVRKAIDVAYGRGWRRS